MTGDLVLVGDNNYKSFVVRVSGTKDVYENGAFIGTVLTGYIEVPAKLHSEVHDELVRLITPAKQPEPPS